MDILAMTGWGAALHRNPRTPENLTRKPPLHRCLELPSGVRRGEGSEV